jgi:hypothetical protein
MRWSKGFPLTFAVLAAISMSGMALVFPARSQVSTGELTIQEPEKAKTPFQSLRDFGSFGSYLGVMKVFGGDLGKDSQLKPVMQGVFRYRFSDDWVGLGEFGFGWNSFKDRGDTVVTFTYGTLGAARHVGNKLGFEWRLSAGPGAYRWNYKYHGKSLLDPETYRPYRGMSLGGFIGAEAERRITSHVTLVGALQQHMVFSADSHLFHSVFNKNYPFLAIRVGANYHFSPYEGILWEKKGSKKIRLESGREGK